MTLNLDDSVSMAVIRACPALGLADDPATRASFPTAAHRCFRGTRPALIDGEHQLRLCLGEDFERCPIWSNPELAQPPRQRRVPLPVLAIGAALVVALISIGGVLVLRFQGQSSVPVQTVPLATPLPASASAPAGIGPAVTSYTVREGDTLDAVAAFFGAPPADVIALNSLPPSGILTPGVTILIPTR